MADIDHVTVHSALLGLFPNARPRTVELAADRGLITRDSAKTRPSDKITKAEALALAWKGSGMSIENHDDEDGTFYDSNDKPAEKWQENVHVASQ